MTSSDREPTTAPLKVLVVEDEIIVGMDLVMQLEDWGYNATGPIKNVDAALAEIEKFGPDMAILDVNLGNGVTSMPIADKLKKTGIPFLFLSGYDSSRFDSASDFGPVTCLRKPIVLDELRETLAQIAPEAVTSRG